MQAAAAARRAPHQDAGTVAEPLLAGEGARPSSEKAPPWREQVTARGVVVGAALGAFLCLIEHHCNLRVGLAPNVNLAAGLLSYLLISAWRRLCGWLGFEAAPFTKQENTMIQTSAVSIYMLAFSGHVTSFKRCIGNRVNVDSNLDFYNNIYL